MQYKINYFYLFFAIFSALASMIQKTFKQGATMLDLIFNKNSNATKVMKSFK
jgi:hypothetical protein